MSSVLRYPAPADSRRPQKATRYDVWSPKVGRLLKLFGRRAFSTWLAIEADSRITGFCERPLVHLVGGKARVIDFWAQCGPHEALWILVREGERSSGARENGNFSDLERWANAQNISVRYMLPGERMLTPLAETNWNRILPYLTANRELLNQELLQHIRAVCDKPISLGQLENRLTSEDPVIVRTGVFALLHRGLLTASTLETADLTADTQVCRA